MVVITVKDRTTRGICLAYLVYVSTPTDDLLTRFDSKVERQTLNQVVTGKRIY